MKRLLGIGILAALFFSSTFILNRAMSLGGGSWVWTASLRYAYTLLLIVAGFILTGRARMLGDVARVFARHWLFWILAGTIGFGIFYAGASLAAAYAPGWVVATTWQTTILATALVLALFGRRVPMRGLIFTVLIFAGIILVNLEGAAQTSREQILRGAIPVLIAAIAYPLGMQMVWEARNANTPGLAPRTRFRWIPAINDPIVDQPFGRVLLLVLGSVPFWIILTIAMQPPAPTQSQWINTLLVALLSGVIATVLFMQARHLAHTSYELAAVDSTQSTEVIWSLLGEVLLLGAPLPGMLGWAGVSLTIFGLALFLLAQTRPAPTPTPARLQDAR